MVNLGSVSPQEREAAFESMQGLLEATGVRSAAPKRTNTSAMADDYSNPAAALLASQARQEADQVDLSSYALQASATNGPQNAFGQAGVHLGNNGSPTANHESGSFGGGANNWQHLPPDLLADILNGERPIVIATVINQVSVERATEIVQALPIAVAGATLAALPHLHLTDPAILRDIQQELERKIGQYEVPRQETAEGLAKLQAILAGMPASQIDIWTNSIAQSNPILASKLGWRTASATATHRSIDTETGTTIKAMNNPVVPSPVASVGFVKSKSESVETWEGDVFDDSIVLPFSTAANANQATRGFPNKAESTETQDQREQTNRQTVAASKVAPAVETNQAPLERLSQLDDRDFVHVLHACQPNTVLLALSGASKDFVMRVERLVPAKDVKRLRARLNSMGQIQFRDVDAAQAFIADKAQELLSKGEIGALAVVAFTAAA